MLAGSRCGTGDGREGGEVGQWVLRLGRRGERDQSGARGEGDGEWIGSARGGGLVLRESGMLSLFKWWIGGLELTQEGAAPGQDRLAVAVIGVGPGDRESQKGSRPRAGRSRI